ncbi:hypothetical protein KKF55_04610 [Patescibacteria group bacterium]|nr:hypothetical protein [Patescibacteria group bacterium]
MLCRYLYLSFIRVTTLLYLLTQPLFGKVYAQTLVPDSYESCNFKDGIIHANCIPEYIEYLIKIIFSLIGAFFFVMIIIAGYQIAIGTVVGEKEKGKEKLKWAIFGFVISALSFFIVQFFISAVLTGVS